MPWTSKASRVLLLCAVVTAIGCASGAARYAGELPGSRLSEMRRFYVEKQAEDPRDIHLAIRDELRALGLDADAGDAAPPDGYDAIITYVDRYQWDVTMFCIQLTLYVKDTQTLVVAARHGAQDAEGPCAPHPR